MNKPGERSMRALPLVLLAAGILLAGCQSTALHRNSSVVDYLYPDAGNVTVSTETPRLTLPLSVGIAFTPGGYGSDGLTEGGKSALLADVADHFEALEFVDSIQIIPTAYLRPGGSFENLDQLRRMFGVDVIVLLSFDQTRFTDEGFASFAYWTLIGAYVVPGEKNATFTLLDAVVYDIPSRKLLFRAPGSSKVSSRATPVNLGEQTREDSVEGFETASDDLVKNLEAELARFQERIKERPEDVHIATREGYRGSGAGGWWLLPIIGLLLTVRLRR